MQEIKYIIRKYYNQKGDSFIVRIFVIFNNPQITKAQLYKITRSKDKYNKGSGM